MFIFYLLKKITGELYAKAHGSGMVHVTKGKFESTKVLLPPLEEQKRIVEKIEALFSELDAGVASLQLALAQLGTYRQALLKHAFEGKLTADWRKAQGDRLQSAETLLAQISAERHARHQQQLDEWQAAVAQWQADGKPGKKPRKPRPLKELGEIGEEESAEMPELPDGWAYVQLGTVIDEPQYGTSKKCTYEAEGIGVLRIPNVVSGLIDSEDLKFAQFDSYEIEQYQLLEGDILIIRSNGSISIVGKCAQVSKFDEQFLYAGYLIRLRPHSASVNSNYLSHNLSGHGARRQIESKAKSTSGVNNINSGEIQSLIIPICSVDEQLQIVEQLDKKLSVLSQLEREISENLQKAEALRQSILKQAFAGQLVPQDPNDEPASALLARIRASADGVSGKQTKLAL